jgi:hypothetical protein
MADSTELRLAKMYREEGDKLREQASADLEAARYERGQIEHAKRTMEQTERSIAVREQKLKELGEPEFAAREQAAEAKLAEAKTLLAQYSADRHGAAIALQQINEREKAERLEAA